MNNPINTNSFRHFLIIRGVEYEIQEPNKFDQSNFKIVQDDIARDTFFGNEETPLEFEVSFGASTATYQDNNGVLINHLSSGAELLIQENLDYGNEADVKYKLTKNNVSFTVGNIDFNKDYNTDNQTYVHCRVIQNSNQSLIKKREDITIDLLAEKDLDDNPISAIPVQKLFLKAKPVYSVSIHENSKDVFYTQGYPNEPEFFNSLMKIKQQNAFNNALSWISLTEVGNYTSNEVRDVGKMVKIEDDLSDIRIKINLDCNISYFNNQYNAPIVLFGICFFCGFVGAEWLANINDPSRTFYSKVFTSGSFDNINQTFTIDFPFGANGKFIYVVFISASSNDGNAFLEQKFNNSTIEIESSATAISSVTNALRYIDLIKQTYKGIGSLPVNAEKYDVDGEFYDNFCFNKNLIKQNTTSPFYVKLKDVKEQLLEQCAYAQVNDDEIYVGKFEDFYTNNYMAGFIEVPDYENSICKNPKYLVNKFVFEYEKYEQDRNEKNTNDAIHTDSEWFIQADNSINTKSLKLPFNRDSFLNEYMRRDVFSTKENSNESDTIGIVDVTLLPPNARNKFTRLLTWNADRVAGTTKILSDNTFSWDLLGFNIGDTIIESGVSRTVLAITPTLLTLSFSGGIANGTNFLTLDYPLTNVIYTNRTNEGLIYSENLRNSDNFGNLRYSIKRNLKHWYSFLATYGKFIPNKKVKNTYFKSNGECITQILDEPLPIKENADININDISSYKILSQDMYKTTVKCEFEQAVQLLNDIQNVRGFIIVQTPIGAVVEGYIKEANFLWSDGILELELEIKNESDFLTINYNAGILTINEVGYPVNTTNKKIYNIFNDFIQFFDEKNINLCNRTRYDKVSLNGATFDNIDDLVNAIENL